MYNSFAIWYDKKPSQGSEELCAELHFNLWQFSFQSKKSLDCLDIGIKLEKITSCSSIKLFIPFEIEEKHVHDLGRVITSNNKLITAIFNEFGTIEHLEPKLSKVTLRNKEKESFYIYTIDGAQNFTISSHEEGEAASKRKVGTIISIVTQDISPDEGTLPIYLRIRIDLSLTNIVNKILYEHVPKDSMLQSSAKKNQFIDFRLNENRNLPITIQEICKNKLFKINKIHFFLMREFMDDFIMSNPPYSGCRVLENDTWLEYFKDKSNLELNNMLAYHWKAKYDNSSNNDSNNFTLLSKFCFQESSNTKILSFLVITIFIGFFAGIGGNYLTNYLTQLFSGNKNCMVELTNIPKSKLNSLIKMTNIECSFIFKTIK